jgi:hypothetical protein
MVLRRVFAFPHSDEYGDSACQKTASRIALDSVASWHAEAREKEKNSVLKTAN